MTTENAPANVTNPAAPRPDSVAVGVNGFDPKNAEQLMQMAKFIAQSELKPAGIKTAPDCFLVMAIGMSYGFDPMMALQTLHIVKGKVGLPGETCAALIQSHPQCRDFRVWVEGEGLQRKACVQSWRKGREQANEVSEFSMAQAKQAGLSGENWQKYPDDMLIWKAVARDKRRNWPDVFPRMQVVEDMEESPAERVVTNVRRESAPSLGPDPLMSQIEAGASADAEIVANGHAEEAERAERQGTLL